MRKKKEQTVETPKSSAEERTQPLPFVSPTAAAPPPAEPMTYPGSPGAGKCAVCGSPLVITNGDKLWCPKGHPQGAVTTAADLRGAEQALHDAPVPMFDADKRTQPTVVNAQVTDPRGSVEYVDVTWGEELYAPLQWHSYRVGPFFARVHVAPGETHTQAAARGLESLAPVAAQERARKRREYLDFIEKNPSAR